MALIGPDAEPLNGEFTGPVVLFAFGFLLRRLPSYEIGPIADTQRIGTYAILLAIIGAILTIVRYVMNNRNPEPRA